MLRFKTVLCLTAFTTLVAAQTGMAQWNGLAGQTNLYPAYFKGVCVTTNESGLDYDWVGNRHFIEDCAAEHGITNLSGLRLVYNLTNDTLQVVGVTNQLNPNPTNLSILCTVLSFEDSLWLPNTNHTVVERLAFVFVGTNQVAGGTLTAKEWYKYGPSNELVSFRLSGQLAYTEPAEGTNSAAICRGTLLVGFGLKPPGDCRGDDDDDNGKGKGKDKDKDKVKPGNNGKHLGQIKNGNNGKKP